MEIREPVPESLYLLPYHISDGQTLHGRTTDAIYEYPLLYARDPELVKQSFGDPFGTSMKVIHSSGYTIIDKEVADNYPLGEKNEIILESIPPSLDRISFLLYAHTTLAAVSTVDMTGMKVVDFGSGVGLQSFVALKKKAEHAVLVDNDSFSQKIAQRSAELNGFSGKTTHVVEDIKNLTQPDNNPGLIESCNFAICNIGPHEIYDGQNGVQELVWRLIQGRGHNLKGIVLGGFMEDNNLNAAIKQDLSSRYILGRYDQLGFVPQHRVSLTLDDGRIAHTAFVLTRE